MHKDMNLVFEISVLGSVPIVLYFGGFCKNCIIFKNVENFPIFFLSRNTNMCAKVENILEYPRFIYLFDTEMLNLTYNYGNKHDCSFGILGTETMHFYPNMKTWEQMGTGFSCLKLKDGILYPRVNFVL